MTKRTKLVLVGLLIALLLATMPGASFASPGLLQVDQGEESPAPSAAYSTVYVKTYFNQNYYKAKIRLLKRTYDGSYLSLYSRGPYSSSPAYASPPFWGLSPEWYKVAITYYRKSDGRAMTTQYSGAFYLTGWNYKSLVFYGP